MLVNIAEKHAAKRIIAGIACAGILDEADMKREAKGRPEVAVVVPMPPPDPAAANERSRRRWSAA